MYNKILKTNVVWPDREVYHFEYSDEIVNLVNGLLAKKREDRLGTKGGVEEVIGHPFFASIDVD